jgi:hypothetical protein
MISAMRRLFKRCLPKFLSLFPWLALIAMIIALLLLILALIEYIINRILQLIRDLLANLETLSRGLTLQDDDSVTAAAQKIAQLLCLIENLIAILIAIASIIAIINALAGIKGRSACGGGGRGAPISGDDPNCCDNEVCPPFIAENPEGLIGTSGELIYYKQINTNLQGILGISSSVAAQFNLPPLRSESWQFVDQATSQEYSFVDIITPLGEGDIFYPEGVTFNKNTKPRRAPYTLDMILSDFDPSLFIASDSGGARTFKIKDLIVVQKPYVGIFDKDNQTDTSFNLTGTLALAGGLVFEIPEVGQDSDGDGIPDGIPYFINGKQATIENFIHLDPVTGDFPVNDDGYFITNVEFLLRIRHEVLIDYGLITLGCHPDLFQERFIANTRVESTGFDAIAVRLPSVGPGGILPDALGAHECATAAIAKLRGDVSIAKVQEFQATIFDCLDDFRDQTLSSYCNILRAGVSIFESTIDLDTDLQFITRPINVKLLLKDPNGTNIGGNIPTTCAQTMESLLDGYVTHGVISDFKYDGYESFTAQITADSAGTGQLTVTYDNNVLKRILNVDDDTLQTVSEDNILNYTFISTTIISKTSGAEDTETGVRRDESDVSREGT